jgi:GR25 family glycosyltransferase involved in LPS biosynthesis/tetratricopeptide (TPR) repeat protein
MPNNSHSYTDENRKVISKTPISKNPISNKTICLNMIVKNEAHIIRETFDNILKYIPLSYWVISDTGSTDGTQQIIKDYFKSRNINGELFQDEWRDFGYNRTLALQHANKKTDYLFIFDADDSIHGDFKIPDNHMFHGEMYNLKFGGDNVAYVRPLLINNHLEWRFNGVLHEFLSCVSKSVEGTIVNGNYYIESGRKGSRSKDPEKYKKDAEVLKRAYYTDIDKPDKGLSNRYAFYCAQSYKDCGMIKEAIEWYKMVADKLDTWAQERYYSCFVLGDLYMRNNDFENAIRYLTKSILFDHERVEGVALACEILLQREMYLLCCSLGDHFLGHTSPPPNKLFLFEPFYFNHIEYSCSIAGFYCGKHELGYECCKKIITTRCIDNVDKYIKTCINLAFYKDQLRNDKDDTLVLFYEYNENIQKLLNDNIDIDPRIHECWNILYEKNHTKLFELPKNIKTMFHNKTVNIHKNKNEKINEKINVFISFTTCKRFDLFKQTLGSILNHWLDVEKIDYWFCVDDNSSKKDRELMKSTFPWITYYMKSESQRGHRESMNIIWDKLSELRPKYWIHMEDDFLFYTRRNYVEDSITILKKYHDSKNVRQVLFNRNYAETIEHTNTKGHIVLEAKTSEECMPVLLHNHNTSEQFHFPNCCYWPDYSFRPSMIDVDTILGLGNYNTENQFFEMDYAYKWYNAGYRSAFYNMVCCRHIGRLTSDRHDKTKPNSYELNNTLQFNLDKSHASVASHDFNTCIESIKVDATASSIVTCESMRRSYSPPIKVASLSMIKILNLKHRDDRKISMLKQLNSSGFSDTEYEFVEAVYGKELSSAPTMELYKMFEGNDFGSRCGFIGCALSHYGLWMELLRDETNDYYIIFEDDVILCDAYKTQISNMEKYFREKDVVYHGYTMYKDIRTNYKNIYEYSSVNNKTNVSIYPLKKEYYIGGTFGYTINKNGARKMINYIHKHGIQHGIDYVMKIANNLECYETQPNLCISLWHEDDTAYDTDIQNYYDVINFGIYENYYLQILKDMFFFIPCKDQIGHDIYHKPASLKNMVLRAIDDKHCVAFNTLGFFKNNIVNTTTSSWFRDGDGIYIKKEYLYKKREMMKRDDCNHELQHLIDSIILEGIKTCEEQQMREIINNSDISDNSKHVKFNSKDKKRVKMLCNWCFSNNLCIEFSNMFMDGEYEKWNDIELVSHNNKTEIDYYVIINMPHMIPYSSSIYETTEYYDPKKTIIFQMEPWVYDTTKNWGVKTWGEWAVPDPNKFMKVFRHVEHLNNVQWQVSPPEYIPEGDKKNKVISIVSDKLHDEGHKKRVDFLKRLDLTELYNGDNIHDVYGRENYHGLQSYVGKTDNKRELVKYKYCFSCENNWEKNYATEKIWEPILFECLCFYWGCPNLEDHIDSRAFVRLPLDNFDESVSIIRRAIDEDWWSQRIDIIKKEKQKIINELGFFPRLHKIIHES